MRSTKYARLLHLADCLEHLTATRQRLVMPKDMPRPKFNICSWFKKTYLYNSVDVFKPCGTSACAAGYAGLLPEFRKLGFKTSTEGWISYKDDSSVDDSLCEFFRINQTTVESIFYPEAYADSPTAREVARRIRKVVKGLNNEND